MNTAGRNDKDLDPELVESFIAEYKKFSPKDYEEEDKTRTKIQEIVTAKVKDATNAGKPVCDDTAVKEVVGSERV